MKTQRQIVLEILLAAGTDYITTAEVFNKIPINNLNQFPDGANQVSKILNALRANAQVENGTPEYVNGKSRLTWRTTTSGRVLLDILQEDPDFTEEQKQLRDTDGHTGASPNELDAISEQIAIVKFDTSDDLDRYLLTTVNMIREAYSQNALAIERKSEKIALLEKMENNDLLPGNTRALLGYIRQDIEQLGDAA